MSKFSGIKLMEWAPTGTSSWTSFGRLKNDSTHNPEVQAVEDAAGLDMFAGEKDQYTVHVYDPSLEAAIRTKAIDDDNIVDLKITYLDDSTVTESNFSMICGGWKKGFQTGQRNFFPVNLKRFLTS